MVGLTNGYMARTKGIGNLEQDVESRAQAIINEFNGFTDGVRYLCLLHRSKDGGQNKEYHRRSAFFITLNTEEYRDAVERLLILQAVSSKPYRLYASVNARDIQKTERQMKIEMLEADFASAENKQFMYERFCSRWAGALMKPGSRSGSSFILDVDGEGDVTAPVLKKLAEINIEPLMQYKTPNGWHIITPPFNPQLIESDGCEVKKDGLILLNGSDI